MRCIGPASPALSNSPLDLNFHLLSLQELYFVSMSSDVELNRFENDIDSDDEVDWEEVDVPVHLDVDPEERQHIEITLKPLVSGKGKKKATEEFKYVAAYTLENEPNAQPGRRD